MKQSRTHPRRRTFVRVLLGLFLLLLVGAAGFLWWASDPALPMPEATAAMQSDTIVSVNQERWIEFTPVSTPVTTGLIFYPGGLVTASAYAPAMRQIAQAGYYAVIVPMPLHLAVIAPNRADGVIAAHPEIQRWVIAGHSLGGAMAAAYVYNHPDKLQGLVFWAAYPAGSNDLSSFKGLQVTSIYGTVDGLATLEKINASKLLLPSDTRFVAIEGGNHAQFGWYGAQSGDRPATISRQEQQAQVIKATLQALSGQ